MSPSASGRAVLAAASTAAGLFAFLLLTAAPAAAHTVEGGELPAPPWLLAYVGAFTVLAAAFVVRGAWSSARLGATDVTAAAEPGAPAAAPSGLHVGHAIGSTVLALVVVAAIAGDDSAAANVAPVGVLVWWLAVPIAALLLGDAMAAVNPFHLPASALRSALGATAPASRASAPPWTAAAFLAAFSWFFLAYHRPGSPRAVAVLLLVYAAAAVAGAVRWGRGWLARGEGFGGLSAAVALISWRRSDRRPVPGLAALVVVWIASAVFDGLSSTTFWTDVLGSSRGWSRTMLNTVGLVWVTAIVGGAYLLAVRVAEHRSDGGRSLLHPLAVALVPLGLAWFVAHELTLLLIEGQNLIILVSDPLGRGWDLFGTARDFDPDYGIVEERWLRWVQLAVLLIGHVAAVLLAHDVALRLRRRREVAATTWAVAVLAATSVVTAAYLVL